MFRATLLFISMFIGTLALILLVLSAFGRGQMWFTSSDKLRAGFAGFQNRNVYLAWQSFLDGTVDVPHTLDMSQWGLIGVSVPRGGMSSSGRTSIDLDSRIAGIGWTSEPMVARLGLVAPRAAGAQPAMKPRIVAGVFRANYYSVKIPLLWIVLLAAAYPALVARRQFITRRRITRGQCVECGYDLRESRDRCPECGSPISATSPPLPESASSSVAS
jgi:hypothetical protein